MKRLMARSGAREYLRATAIVAFATAVCLVLRVHLASIDVAMVLLLAVVAAAATHRRGPALLASCLSIVAFDLLFVLPYGTFNVFDTAYYLTFIVMLAVALTMSGLTGRIREELDAAGARERRSTALRALERDLAAAPDLEGLRSTITRHLGHQVDGSAHLLLTDDLESSDGPLTSERGIFADTGVRVAVQWAWAEREATGWSTPHGRELQAMVVPLVAESGALGLAVLVPAESDQELDEEAATTLAGLIALATGALERRQLAREHERTQSEVEAERLRTSLLSSLSHDLRTPLAAIEGSASSLLESAGHLSPAVQKDLLEGIVEESRRMTRLIGNLLDMVRVETGTLAVQKSWQPLEEPLGVALLRMEERLAAHPVATDLPRDLPMVPIDELLIEQVFVNLLENAVRYTPPGTPIEISARHDGECIIVEVADRGPGVRHGDEEAVFERFHRGTDASSADAGAGAGLGLTICRGIVRAHGGQITLASRAGGGTTIHFTLPWSAMPEPALAAEADNG